MVTNQSVFCCRSPRKCSGNPPQSPLIVNKKTHQQDETVVFGFNAPVTTTYTTPTINTIAATSNILKHLDLSEDPLGKDKLVTSCSSTNSLFNGVPHCTPVNGNSSPVIVDRSPTSPTDLEHVLNGKNRSPSPAIPTKSSHPYERVSPPSNRPLHLRLS